MNSSPAVRPPSSSSDRPRGEPTVTPRRFGRFFTPRSSAPTSARSLFSSTTPLTDITSSPTARNNTLTAKPQTALSVPDLVSAKQDENGNPQTAVLSGQKRKFDAAESGERSVMLEQSEQSEPLYPVRRSDIRIRLGGSLRRELDWTSCNLVRSTNDYRAQFERHEGLETWHNSEKDVHIMFSANDEDWEIASEPQTSMPFSSASCHTNPTIALGDDDGWIRFLDTSADSSKGFQGQLVSFAAHRNTITDLAFSFDDLRIATAGGDNVCRIFDVKTQQDIFSLSGHTDSLKRVLWQPGPVGNDNILVTSSRDFTVKIWDLRIRGSEVHSFSEGVGCVDTPRRRKKIPTRSIGVVNTLTNLYQIKMKRIVNASGRQVRPVRVTEDQVNSMAFLPHAPHLLLTGASQQGVIKMWDIRQSRGDRSVPVSSVTIAQKLGTVAMATNTNGTRLFTLSRDTIVRAFSTQHFFQGAAPELSSGKSCRSRGFESTTKHVWAEAADSEGGPASFFARLVCRPATADQPELLAMGSDANGAIIMHTDERVHASHRVRYREEDDVDEHWKPPDYGDHMLVREKDKGYLHEHNFEDCEFCDDRTDLCPASQFIHGHDGDVDSVSWTSEGNLVTCGNDRTVRLWRPEKTGRIPLTACELGERQYCCPHHRHHHSLSTE